MYVQKEWYGQTEANTTYPDDRGREKKDVRSAQRVTTEIHWTRFNDAGQLLRKVKRERLNFLNLASWRIEIKDLSRS